MVGSTTRVGATFGHYEIRALLGRGGMGEVYEAYDTAKDRVVALKILADQHSADEAFRERFRRESHAAAKLQEPHVIPIHDWGDVDGTLYIDMRRVNGVDVHTLLKGGPVEPARAVAVISQVAAALEAAHGAGLIHRDVKPENIIVTPADFAYLVDFGIAEAAGETRLTGVGTAIGSFAYMAPERFGNGDVTPAADVYSLACVLHEMLSGSAPYPSTSLQQVIAAHTSAPPPRPSAVNPAVPASFDDVIARGMAKEPDDRYGSAGAFARAAQRALRPAPPHPAANATLAASNAPTGVASASYAPGPHPPLPAQSPGLLHRQAGPGQQRQTSLIVALAAAAVAAVVAAVGVTALITTRGHGAPEPGMLTPTVAAGVTPRPAPKPLPVPEPPPPVVAPPTPVVALPPQARVCPALSAGSGAYTRSAAGTQVTTCPFAEAVRVAYGGSGPPSPVPRVVNAYSPVTRQSYPMTCVANRVLATCTGGDDAVVYVY